MTLRNMLLATVSIGIIGAFDNGAGWKMDGDKIAVDGEGNPIYVGTDGREMSVKHDTISNLNREAKNHREAKETAETQLAKYRSSDGKLLDPEIARNAIETVSRIDQKQLIDAGEVDKVRNSIKDEFTSQLTEKDQALAAAQQQIDNMLIDSVFKGSNFVRENLAVPQDMFEAAMRSNFKVEDGKVVAYDKNGNRLMSKKSAGEYADPDEALQILVDSHPQRDTILRAPDASGSGGGGGGGNRGQSRTIKRSEFDGLPDQRKAEISASMAKGEVTIVD